MTEAKSPLKTALCEFKQKSISIKKTSDNPFFKSKYADLATILDAVENEAAKCGLVLISALIQSEGGLLLETRLEHKDNEEARVSAFPVFGAKPQEIGSSITYARRYNILSLLNLAAEDDDGNAANTATQFKTGGERKVTGTEILSAMDATESAEELDQVSADYKQDINKFKYGNKQDKEFYEQIIARGKELKVQFNTVGLNDSIPDFR